MMRLRRALLRRRARRAELSMQLARARAASAELGRQYRAQPALPLGIAALGGFALAQVRRDWRPPNAWLHFVWRWGMLLLRGLV